MNYVENFDFTAKAKKKLIITLAVGVVLFVIGCVGLASGSALFDPALKSHGHDSHSALSTGLDLAENASAHGEAVSAGDDHSHGHHYTFWTRIKAVLWHTNIYFIGISLIGIFFYCLQLVTWAGWSALLKRVFLAVGAFVPVAGVLLVVMYVFFNHDLFHWTAEGIMEEGSANYDKIIAGKSWYLGFWDVLIRTFIYIGGWVLFTFFLKKEAVLQDQTGDLIHHNRSINIAGGFIVFFGVSSSMCSWDWIMSIDTHWFSTMFGWYVFASWFVSGLAVITLFVIELKKAGYLQKVNENHIHDLGKFVFAFSVFWAYIWFSQFILYWYSNIPEEIVWFNERMFFNRGNYMGMFVFNLIINFVFPFFFLMTRDAKRQMVWLKVACVAIVIGHWFDTYLMIMPGILKVHGGLNFGSLFLELGVVLAYVGLFGYVVLNSMSKIPLIAKNHPMLEESINFHQ